MSLTSANPPGESKTRSVRIPAGSGREDMLLYTSAGVSTDMALTLHMRSPEDLGVSLLFGHERLTLEFFDVESLERLRDLADEGARRLRAAFELHAAGVS